LGDVTEPRSFLGSARNPRTGEGVNSGGRQAKPWVVRRGDQIVCTTDNSTGKLERSQSDSPPGSYIRRIGWPKKRRFPTGQNEQAARRTVRAAAAVDLRRDITQARVLSDVTGGGPGCFGSRVPVWMPGCIGGAHSRRAWSRPMPARHVDDSGGAMSGAFSDAEMPASARSAVNLPERFPFAARCDNVTIVQRSRLLMGQRPIPLRRTTPTPSFIALRRARCRSLTLLEVGQKGQLRRSGHR
jgi:hypothetical protein